VSGTADGGACSAAAALPGDGVTQIRPGLWMIPVPWPGSTLRHTLPYLVSSPRGVALIDTGWPTGHGWSALLAGIARTGHEVTDVRQVLVTHAHADHLGLAGRIREVSGARIGMHPAEAATLARAGGPPWRPALTAWLQARGAPPDEAADILGSMAGPAGQHARLAHPDDRIEDGSRPLGPGTPMVAIWTPGHTPGHLCFYDEGQEILLTGDHLLPRITPNIGLPPGQHGDPLGDYLASLRGLARYRPAEILPAHEHRFADLGRRVEAVLRHHRIRLAEIERVVAADPGLSTWAAAARLTWSRAWAQTRQTARHGAVSETYAHLVHLRAGGRVLKRGGTVDSWHPGPQQAVGPASAARPDHRPAGDDRDE
jgi:glyoxylase-like metal-dependent hydrolase (beta-lactamase superfamily II)